MPNDLSDKIKNLLKRYLTKLVLSSTNLLNVSHTFYYIRTFNKESIKSIIIKITGTTQQSTT